MTDFETDVKALGELVESPNSSPESIGIPADIYPFEGTRIVLLQDSPYERTWNAQRLFQDMVGEIEVVKVLDQAKYQGWIKRISEANR